MLMWGGNVSASALSGQKRALDTMELELLVPAPPDTGAGN